MYIEEKFIKKTFGFLVEQYGFEQVYQDFENCYGGYWWVQTYSFFNDSGCFTIHNLAQRGELDFYYAKEFISNHREGLCERRIELLDITSVEKEIWDRHSKFLGINNPFFWLGDKKVLSALAEVIKSQIEKNGEFFGIKVERKTND